MLKILLIHIAEGHSLRTTAAIARGLEIADISVSAVGASILTAAYYMLRDGTSYHDLGHDYFVRHNETAVALLLTQRLKDLGYEVDIRKAA